MKGKFLCKLCEDILELKDKSSIISCSCGEISVSASEKGYRIFCETKEESFAYVDDKGNPISLKKEEKDLLESVCEKRMTPEEGYKELLFALKNVIEILKKFSPEARFAPCTNQDFLAHLEWEEAIFSLLLPLMKSLQKTLPEPLASKSRCPL